MNWKQVLVDLLTSGTDGDKIVTQDRITRQVRESVVDIDLDDYITKYQVSQLLPNVNGSNKYKILAGSDMPKPFTLADIPILSLSSTFQNFIPLEGSDTLVDTPSPTQRVDIVYTTIDKTEIDHINVYGDDDGDGKFAYDTWVCVTP